jgi:SAM-dependent methyltransferase
LAIANRPGFVLADSGRCGRSSVTEGTRGYADEADALVRQYESISFDQAHAHTLHLYPPPPARCLDIGAGTGRDAAALAAAGYTVTAAEPTDALRTAGQRIHATSQIKWVEDALPHLALLQAAGAAFDLVLLTAVWMHLDPAERRLAMGAVAALIAPHGTLMLTLRHGPVPPGRRMFDVTGGETRLLAERHGLATVLECDTTDTLSRPDVSWTHLVFRQAA